VEALRSGFFQSHASFPARVLIRLLIYRLMPEVVSDEFALQFGKRVLDIGNVARMHSLPIHKRDSTLATTSAIARFHLPAVKLKAM
jgi:hypothetical protein